MLIEDTKTPSVDATFYHKLVGKLLYAMNCRPDIAFAVSQLSCFMAKPQEAHLNVAFQTLQYIRGSLTEGILYRRNAPLAFEGFTHAT
jgi:hypothetical protein